MASQWTSSAHRVAGALIVAGSLLTAGDLVERISGNSRDDHRPSTTIPGPFLRNGRLTNRSDIPLAAAQDHHSPMTARGAQAMGFDQKLTTHHFYLYEDGGAIEVTVKKRADRRNLTAIRTHLPQLVQLFAKGDFSTPSFIHAQGVPGADQMERLRDRIAYAYEDIRDGGRVRITTRHARALAAVYDFLRFQIQDHKTGDSLEVTRPGH